MSSPTLASLVNHQVRLAARPQGLPGPECWQFTEEAVAEPAEGGVVVKAITWPACTTAVLCDTRGAAG